MESTITTITCPNCGANPTNRRNCEYCGSMLIRFADKNITIDDNKYGKKAKIIPGLESALKSNLAIQKNPIDNIIPITELSSPNGCYQILPANEATFDISAANPYTDGSTGIVLRLPFLVRSSKSTVAHNAQYALNVFRNMDCFQLFDKVDVESGYYYLLNCGEDFETASRMLSTILAEIDGASYFQCVTHTVEKEILTKDKYGNITKKNEAPDVASSLLKVTLLITGILAIIGLIAYLIFI